VGSKKCEKQPKQFEVAAEEIEYSICLNTLFRLNVCSTIGTHVFCTLNQRMVDIEYTGELKLVYYY
jgi:hypothetical protein